MSRPTREEVARTEAPWVVLAVPEGEWGEALCEAFERAGFYPHRTPSPDSITLALAYRSPSAILLDASFIDKAGFRILDSIRISAPHVPVLVTADAADEQLRLKALVLGAEDCLVRPMAGQEAVIRVRRAVERRAQSRRLLEQELAVETRADALQRDILSLRGQLKRNVGLLQRAVDFHLRLEPAADVDATRLAMLKHLSAELSVARLALLTPSHAGGTWFTARATWGVPGRLAERVRIHMAGELASFIEGTGNPLVLDRLARVPGLRLELGVLAAGGFTAVVPLISSGRLVGLVLIGEAPGGGAPDEETLRVGHFLLSALVPALIAQEQRAAERKVTAHTLGTLVMHLEAKDPYLHGHSQRVARLVEEIGARVGFEGDELAQLTLAGLLHDIGRFEVEARLWATPGPLSAADWEIVRRHPEESVKLLGESDWPDLVVNAVRHHHERWDGSGYPHGLREDTIPFEARIIAVADTFDALTSARPHRPALSTAEALRVLRVEAGVKHDPLLVEAMLRGAEATA